MLRVFYHTSSPVDVVSSLGYLIGGELRLVEAFYLLMSVNGTQLIVIVTRKLENTVLSKSNHHALHLQGGLHYTVVLFDL